MSRFVFVLTLLAACSTTDDTAPERNGRQHSAVDTAQDSGAADCTIVAYVDNDEDGFGNPNRQKSDLCELPAGYSLVADDCDDKDALVSPGVIETCNDLDDNCDGDVDEDAGTGWHPDLDGDSYGDPSFEVTDCAGFPGYVADGTDCNDHDDLIHPAALEFCDHVDNDCDDVLDEDAADAWAWYPDADGDGRSTISESEPPIMACVYDRPVGTNSDHSDCNDADPAISPLASELCDGIDNDCDDEVDNNAIDATVYYPDNDRDGYGDMNGWYGPPTASCTPVADQVADGTDCDDDWDWVNPSATEVCDWMDNDCDGYLDDEDPDGVEGTGTWYVDEDMDGYGSTTVSAEGVCELGAYMSSMGWNVVMNSTDCDDKSDLVSPGVDNDLDGSSACEDCDDRDWHTNPSVTEIAGNGIDDDCDDETDE